MQYFIKLLLEYCVDNFFYNTGKTQDKLSFNSVNVFFYDLIIIYKILYPKPFFLSKSEKINISGKKRKIRKGENRFLEYLSRVRQIVEPLKL